MAYNYHNNLVENNNNNQITFLNYDYEPSIYNLLDYDPTPFANYRAEYYSTFTPTEPETLKYYYQQPDSHKVAAFYDQSSVSEPLSFNAPGFDEYDPTPYNGGYDIVQTYGSPLPPSDQTCYPRAGSAKTPPPPEKKKEPEKQQQQQQEEEEEEEEEEEYYRTGQPVPSGYGLEAMELCGSLFGHCPCVAKYYSNKIRNGGDGDGGCAAADYLFGGPNPYVERRDGGGSFGQPIHCYERRYRELQAIMSVAQFYHGDDCDDHNYSAWPF